MTSGITEREEEKLVDAIVQSVYDIESSLESSEAIEASVLPPAILSTWLSLVSIASARPKTTGAAVASLAEAIMNNRWMSLVISDVMVIILGDLMRRHIDALRDAAQAALSQEKDDESGAWSHRIMSALAEASAAIESQEEEEEE